MTFWLVSTIIAAALFIINNMEDSNFSFYSLLICYLILVWSESYALYQCEKELPRNQSCQLIAISDETKNDRP